MNIQSAINKELFIPHNERMLVAVEVERRKRKRLSFLPTASKGRYTTFICLSDAGVLNLAIYRCKAFLNRMKNMMVPNRTRSQGRGKAPGQRLSGNTVANVVQRMNVALGERGDRLTRAEDKTVELMHKAQQFADNAHKQ
uniref:Syntaxin binding protein 6 (amisyn), like n=1 Tax=Sphaeramia orbicularis TaxID=375764 RepID=A0A672ZCT6_9TELE